MKKTTSYLRRILLFFLLFLFNFSLAQESIEEIANKSNSYDEFILNSKAYFLKKYGSKEKLIKAVTNKNSSKKSEYHHDNEITKFNRLLHYYNSRITPDGSPIDERVLYEEADKRRNQNKAINPSVTWKNTGPSEYLGIQAGLGRTSAVAFHPTNENIFYVGAGTGGVWKTTDGGLTYSPIGDLLPTLAVGKIVVNQSNPNTIYVATGGKRNSRSFGVFKTTNNGASWQNTFLNFTVNSRKQIYEMIADPSNSNKMFIAVPSDGLYRSLDGMVTGQRVLAGDVHDVIFKPNNPNIVYALVRTSSGVQLMKSTNGGTSFTEIVNSTGGDSDLILATSNADPEKIYFSHSNIVEKYTQSGSQYMGSVDLSKADTTDGITNISTGSLFLSQNKATRIYAGFQSHHRSDSDGSKFEITLSKFNSNFNKDVHVDYNETYFNPLKPDVIYFCNDGGLYEYSESNNAFTNRSNGLIITQFYDIAVGQDAYDRISGGSQDNANVYREPNGKWRYITPTGDGMGQEIDPTNQNILYSSYQDGQLIREINGVNTDIGSNINAISNNEDGWDKGEWLTPYTLDPNNPNTLYAGYKKVYKSTDRGNTWTAISPRFSGRNMQGIAVAPSNSNYIYTMRGGVYYAGDILGDYNGNDKNFYSTTNGGASWNTYNIPGNRGTYAMAVDPNNPLIVYLGISGYYAGEKVFKSTNGGQTWTNISGTLPNGPTNAIVTLKGGAPGAIFAGTDTGVYYKDDSMSDWVEYGTMPHVHVASLVINYCTKTIFAGTHGRSVFYAPLPSGITSGCITYCDPTLSTTSVNQKFTKVEIIDSNNKEIFSNNTSTNTQVFQQYLDSYIKLVKGKSYTLRLTTNNLSTNSHGAAYIDYNSDTDWIDANEIIGSFQQTVNASNVVKNITFTVPANPSELPGRLRIRLLENGVLIPESCALNNGSDGNTQDYKVVFIDAPSYCVPQVNGTPNEKITQVRILNASNTPIFTYNSDSQSVLYQNTTNQNITLEKGKSYTLEVKINNFFINNHFAAYLDYNDNLDWEAPNELLGNIQSGNIDQSNITKTINFTVPNTAVATTSSRLRLRYLYDGEIVPNPCLLNGGFAGETEDYNVTIINNPLSIDNQILEDKLELYPNPTKNILYIKGVDTKSIEYSVLDLSGRVVIDTNKYANGISLESLTKGIYLVQVTLDGAKTIKRVVLE